LDDLFEEESSHSVHSTLRERIVEHVFVGDALRRLWQRGVTDVEVLRSEFDAGGYDLVMSYRKVVRHIQFKSVMEDGKAANVKVASSLSSRMMRPLTACRARYHGRGARRQTVGGVSGLCGEFGVKKKIPPVITGGLRIQLYVRSAAVAAAGWG